MQRVCRNQWCSKQFEINEDDLKFYEKVSPEFGGKKYLIPPPTLCPDCRMQQRLTFRNERSLHKRKCDRTGEGIISLFSEEKPYIVFKPEIWWSDQWDGLDYGRLFDFSKPFFQQYNELLKATPKLSLMIMNSENCSYTSYTINYKNAYMSMSGYQGENIYYSYYINESRDCTDCSILNHAELCYECLDGNHLYHCTWCVDCENISDSIGCFDCKNCSNCIGCVGLRNKKNYIFNEPCSDEDFNEKKITMLKSGRGAFAEIQDEAQKMRTQYPHLFSIITNSENCTGNLIYNSKNAKNCFDITDVEDAEYCTNILYAKDCQDSNYFPRCELMYEIVSSNKSSGQCFCYTSWESHRLLYCHECMKCADCFACCGLKNKNFCIFNKQYTKKEYEQIVPQVIEHMSKDGEWGEYFPASISPYGYNETVSIERFPLTKKEILSKGYAWYEHADVPPQVVKIIKAKDLPDTIEEIPDDILNWAIECEVTKRPFKIIKQELDFYRRMQLPIPHLHPDERHRKRMALRNPRKLWNRECAKCNKPIATSYSPERPEIVYCEECYLKEVY